MSESKHTPAPWKADYIGSDGAFTIATDHFVICSRNPLEHRAEQSRANALVITAAPDLLEAAQLLEAAELARQDCEECEGEGEPEACEGCFPAFDDARIKRRLAIAKAVAG